MTKINARIISKAHAHLQIMEEIVQSFKKTGIKLYEALCSRGTTCLYIDGENKKKKKIAMREKRKKKKNLTIISKPHALPHTMKKTYAKFHIRSVQNCSRSCARKRYPLSIY